MKDMIYSEKQHSITDNLKVTTKHGKKVINSFHVYVTE
jgi:hypothetical protein